MGLVESVRLYFAGRGGMLGDVGPEVVSSAFGWFEPSRVTTFFDEGAAINGASTSALRMAEAHALWGRKHLGEVEGLGDIVAVTETLVDGLEGSGLPLFCGWRAAPRAGDDAGRAAQLMQILREWRGGLHLVATTASGLSPRDAILTNEGEGQAKFFGWPAPYPDCADIRFQHDEAEALTDQLSVTSLRRALSRPVRRVDRRSGRNPRRPPLGAGAGSMAPWGTSRHSATVKRCAKGRHPSN